MSRTKGGFKTRRRHKKYLKMARGYYGLRHSAYRRARETVERALCYAYVGRKLKKREFRRLWNIRINAFVRQYGLNYSRFINLLKQKDIRLNRKMLALLAVEDPEAMKAVVEQAKGS